MDSTNVAEIFASMGVAGGVTAILSMILLRQIDRAAEERQEWLAQMRAESAETRAPLNELRQAVVDLRATIASQMNQT